MWQWRHNSMISRHFRLSSELSGAIAKRLPHAKNQFSVPWSFFNQFVTNINHNNRVLIVRIDSRFIFSRLRFLRAPFLIFNLKYNVYTYEKNIKNARASTSIEKFLQF